MDNYFMSFKLTNFFGSRVERLENEEGDVEECVVIPLKLTMQCMLTHSSQQNQ